jgi:hypothetical protein
MIAVADIATSSVGLVMFMFADAIFVSMSKSHHRNDTVDQQERVRHLRPYLPRESQIEWYRNPHNQNFRRNLPTEPYGYLRLQAVYLKQNKKR